jgi:hypothetical protein
MNYININSNQVSVLNSSTQQRQHPTPEINMKTNSNNISALAKKPCQLNL